jgi:lipoprotein-releasing system ATP-binding protein
MDEKTTQLEAAPSPAVGEDYPIVFLHAITRRFRQGDNALEILKSAELAVWPGQSVALIAPSGAGKSTLLHIAGYSNIRFRAKFTSTRSRPRI